MLKLDKSRQIIKPNNLIKYKKYLKHHKVIKTIIKPKKIESSKIMLNLTIQDKVITNSREQSKF